jgi:hypothetical protein
MRSEAALFPQWQVSSRGGAPSMNSSRWPMLRVGRATTGACLSRSYTALSCGEKTLRGPTAALPGQTCGGVFGAMTRFAPARPATPPNGQRHFFRGTLKFRVFKTEIREGDWGRTRSQAVTPSVRHSVS